MRSNWPFKARRKKSNSWVRLSRNIAVQGSSADCLFMPMSIGEAGKVEESMAKLEAVEALKSEKAEKEVRVVSIGMPCASTDYA